MRQICPPTTQVQEVAERLGARIRMRRKSLRLTLDDMEKKTGIHRTTLGRLERGDTGTSLVVFFSVLESLQELSEVELLLTNPEVPSAKRRPSTPVIDRNF